MRAVHRLQSKWERCSPVIPGLHGELTRLAFYFISKNEDKNPQAAAEPTQKKFDDLNGYRMLGNELNAKGAGIYAVSVRAGDLVNVIVKIAVCFIIVVCQHHYSHFIPNGKIILLYKIANGDVNCCRTSYQY